MTPCVCPPISHTLPCPTPDPTLSCSEEPLAPRRPAVFTARGLGTIAGQGFRSPRLVAATMFVHADRTFSVDFFNLIEFEPFQLPLPTSFHPNWIMVPS